MNQSNTIERKISAMKKTTACISAFVFIGAACFFHCQRSPHSDFNLLQSNATSLFYSFHPLLTGVLIALSQDRGRIVPIFV
jgi:hypothetical protein